MIFDRIAVLRYYGWHKEPTFKECALKSYRDVSRIMVGFGKNDESEDKQNKGTKKIREDKKKTYREGISCLIDDRIGELMESQDWESFDCWHDSVCEKIICMSDEIIDLIEPGTRDKWPNRRLPYGIAQKWLNMTFKNMLIVGKWDDELMIHIKDKLHVPVDSNIKSCAKGSRPEEKLIDDVPDKAWSQWDKEMYCKFQKDLKKAIRDEGRYDSPIEWEFEVFAKNAEKNS